MFRELTLAIICAFLLLMEYRKTKKAFVKAKIFHFITSLFIVVYHFGSFKDLALFIVKFNQEYIRLTEGYSGFLGKVNVVNYFLYLLVSIFLTILGAGLIHKMESVRKLILDFILVFIPINSLSIYMYGIKNDSDYMAIYLFGGIIMSILVYGSIIYLYKQKFMIDFFQSKMDY